ncbi:UxaA family hydrolase [Tepidibacter hydrothermalis]|uniref:UxaA family hydrolase n=1 Tax=Tepidibacter hydrothermalis TaxID=3036126 RepID=A0ABY8EAM0_9FIRM|nr:UxaA family hydrolase [Tepidibacter hydrothermalis]WFD09982.1 UxaA family hydrolase [Tepidibacter hydrothermalis]
MEFNGYVRQDGTVGIRNNILIIAVDECMDGIARKISEKIENSIVLTNHYTCMLGGNEETLSNIINAACNPNVAGALVLAMGCGSIDPEIVADPINKTGRLAKSLTCIKNGGTKKTITQGIELAKEIEVFSKTFKRQPVDISKLVVGVKCGGSDTSSGIASNPSVGKAADLLVDKGAIVIAGELMELVGCEDILCKRAVNDEIAKKIRTLISNEEKRWGVGSDTEIMSIGNSVGGLTTIEEKSLGALNKIGSKPIQGILEFNQQGHEKPTKPGMYLSDVTMLCGGSGMHFAAAGAQLILWTSGGAGFNNSIVPVIRVSGNEDLINEDIDIDATRIMKGLESSDEVGKRILDRIIEVSNGEKTNIEDIGYSYCTLYQKDIRLEQCLGLR